MTAKVNTATHEATRQIRLLSTSEAAARCGVSAAYLRYSVNVGNLPCVRVGAAYGFTAEALDAWNAARTSKKTGRLIRHATQQGYE